LAIHGRASKLNLLILDKKSPTALTVALTMNLKNILLVLPLSLLPMVFGSSSQQLAVAETLQFQERSNSIAQVMNLDDGSNCPGQDGSNSKIPGNFAGDSDDQIIGAIETDVINKTRRKPSKKMDDIERRIKNISTRCKGNKATPERVSAIKDAITLIYIEKGYITTRAELPKIPWVNTSGILVFPVVEGKIGDIKVVDYDERNIERYDHVNRGYNSKYVRDRIQVRPDTPLNIRDLEGQIRLLELDPLFDQDTIDPRCQKYDVNDSKIPKYLICRKIDAVLRPSKSNQNGADNLIKPSQNASDLIVKIPPTKSFRANFNFDNSAPPSIGAERLKADFSFVNLAGLGDNLTASFQIDPLHKSENQLLRFAGFSYQLPLNPMNGTFQVRIERRRERIIQKPFDEFNLKANADLYEIAYRQPLLRNYSNELALSLGLTIQNGQTFVFNDIPFPFGIGPDTEGVSRTSVIKFGQDYIHRGASGTWILKSQFSLGVGLFGTTNNSGSIPDGQFLSWLGQAQRLQQLGENNFIIMQADLQLSPDPLLPSQQFVLGGSQSLRGYRQNVRFGDNGFRFSVEDRITLKRDQNRRPIFQLAPFLDIGKVWNQSDNPNKLPSQRFLAGLGLGLLWQPLPKFNLRLDYALPLVNLPGKGENLQDKGVYFTINYQL
jgi:hemolysin activation/secretion protein